MRFENPTVGIVGGTGKMGDWFADLFRLHGLAVFCSGRRTEFRARDLARRCDVVIVSVPVADTVKIIEEIGPLVRQSSLLMDLTSVKEAPLSAMLKYSSSEVVGGHPLFGPEDSDSDGKRMVFCPGRGEYGMKWATGLLEKSGIEIVFMNPVEHDRIMGLVQGVNHFSTLAMALCICGSGFELEDILKCSTMTFRRRLARIRSMLGQSPSLFESIIVDNPRADKSIEQFKDSVERLFQIVKGKDTGRLDELFDSLKMKLKINDLGDL